MFHATRKWSSIFLLVPALCWSAACQKPARIKASDNKQTASVEATFDPPNTYPEWASDAPQYVKPAQELTPEPKAKAGDPLHYFTREKVIFVRQPAGYTPEEIPRVAVWWSDNNGFRWQRAGYFGREQSYFAFEAPQDGDYGIRFVGPNQEQAEQTPANPERVYHVDTVLPEVEVAIDPEQTWYNVGQSVTISWRADDYHLIELPVTITSLLDFTAEESKPIEVQKGLAKDGSITYQIPPEALNHEMRFRVEALDRATNMGIAYSFALQVVSEPVEASPLRARPKKDEQVAIAPTDSKSDTETLSLSVDRVVANPPAQKNATRQVPDELAVEEKPTEPVLANSIFLEPPDRSITSLTLHPGSKSDITQGNGLLVPMPATVEHDSLEVELAVAHPWRSLVAAIESPIKTIWSLPIADFVRREPRLRELFLAGARMFYPLGEPAGQESNVALNTKE